MVTIFYYVIDTVYTYSCETIDNFFYYFNDALCKQ